MRKTSGAFFVSLVNALMIGCTGEHGRYEERLKEIRSAIPDVGTPAEQALDNIRRVGLLPVVLRRKDRTLIVVRDVTKLSFLYFPCRVRLTKLSVETSSTGRVIESHIDSGMVCW